MFEQNWRFSQIIVLKVAKIIDYIILNAIMFQYYKIHNNITLGGVGGSNIQYTNRFPLPETYAETNVQATNKKGSRMVNLQKIQMQYPSL